MILTGKATDEGTAAYTTRYPTLAYRPFGNTGLHVSQVGFGSYRIDVGVDAHRQALRHALLHGINLIDTSANYADGRSEQLIGEVLTKLMTAGELAREEVIVVSKAGYLQGQNYEIAQARKAAGNPFPNLVKYGEGLDHCIHPEFLADQLGRSLARLNLETLDGYLLHNPEYYLSWAKRASIPLAQARREYYHRIELAFIYLEEQVAHGRIQWYGISSNTFPYQDNHREFTSLTRIWEIAESLTTDHHFRLIQLPMNLLETGAATEKNQPDGRVVLDFAAEKELAVLINRPFNAIQDGTLTRLVSVPLPNYPASADEVSTAVDTSVQIESQFQQDILPKLPVDAVEKRTLLEYLAVGLMLQGRWQGFGTYHNWRDIQTQFLLPRAKNGIEFLSSLENLPAETPDWLETYVEAINITFAAVSAFYQEASARRAEAIQNSAVAADSDWSAPTLSHTAVNALRSTAGITSVLVGMRQEAYVNDILEALSRPIVTKNRAASWQKLKRET